MQWRQAVLELIVMSVKRNFLGVAVGLGIAVFAIALLNFLPTHETAVQVTVWSLTVLAIVVGPYYLYLREGWFWRSLAIVAMIHIAIVVGFKNSLPFSTLGVVILMSVAEGIALGLLFGTLSKGSIR